MSDNNPDEQQGGSQAYDPHRVIAKWTRAVAIFTFFLVAASAASDYFIYQQYRVANDAQTDTREQLRAVITFSGGEILIVKDQNKKPLYYLFLAKFQNFGATRTDTFQAWVSIHYFQGDVPFSQDFSKPWQKIDIGVSIVGPNSATFLSPVTISGQEAADAEAQKGKIVIWGHADWSDIFQTGNIHPINFCQTMQPITDTDGNTTFRPIPLRPDCNTSG